MSDYCEFKFKINPEKQQLDNVHSAIELMGLAVPFYIKVFGVNEYLLHIGELDLEAALPIINKLSQKCCVNFEVYYAPYYPDHDANAIDVFTEAQEPDCYTKFSFWNDEKKYSFEAFKAFIDGDEWEDVDGKIELERVREHPNYDIFNNALYSITVFGTDLEKALPLMHSLSKAFDYLSFSVDHSVYSADGDIIRLN